MFKYMRMIQWLLSVADIFEFSGLKSAFRVEFISESFKTLLEPSWNMRKLWNCVELVWNCVELVCNLCVTCVWLSTWLGSYFQTVLKGITTANCQILTNFEQTNMKCCLPRILCCQCVCSVFMLKIAFYSGLHSPSKDFNETAIFP